MGNLEDGTRRRTILFDVTPHGLRLSFVCFIPPLVLIHVFCTKCLIDNVIFEDRDMVMLMSETHDVPAFGYLRTRIVDNCCMSSSQFRKSCPQ